MSQWHDVAELIQSQLDRIQGESMQAGQVAQHPDAEIECTVDAIAGLIEAKAKVRLQVGPELFRFDSYTQWVNKAQSWFRRVRAGTFVCIDQCGRICATGKQFQRADKEGQFPIVVYAIDPEAES